jgi:hypothetical protein
MTYTINTNRTKVVKLDNPTFTDGIAVYKKCVITIPNGKDSHRINALLSEWLSSGRIKLEYQCTEEEQFLLGLK